jgi:hypothetical protein
MRNALTNVAVILVAVLVSLGGAEALLRGFPSLISIDILQRFHEDLRTPIATRLGYPTGGDMRVLSSAERGDGGPPLDIYRPGRRYVALADPADVTTGAVLERQMDGAGFLNPATGSGRTSADVIMIGDSFTAGPLVAPKDTFTAQIEQQTGLMLYNLGVGGLGPYAELVLLRKFGLALKPRIVVMNIYEGNDLRDILSYHKFVSTGIDRISSKRLGGVFAVSYALAYLKSGVEVMVKRLTKREKINFRYTVEVDGVRTPMNVTNSDTDEVKHARRVENGDISLDLFAEPLEAFVELAAEHGFIAVVTLLPSAHTGYIDSVRFEDEAVGREVAAFSRALRTWLAENAERIGYRFIDVVPAFLGGVESGPIAFFPANVHFTRDGHAIVARALGPALQNLLAGQ